MTGFQDRRKLGQIYEPRPDGRLMIIDSEHFDRVLARITGEVLDALQRMNILEDLDEVLWEQVSSSLEPRCENEEGGSKRVALPLKLVKSCVVYDSFRSSHDG